MRRRVRIRSDGCVGGAGGRLRKGFPCELHREAGFVPSAAPCPSNPGSAQYELRREAGFLPSVLMALCKYDRGRA